MASSNHAFGHGPERSFEDSVRQFGLTAEILRAAVGNGNMERVRVLGRHHSRAAQGFYAWNGTLSKLSEAAEESGFDRHDPLGLPVLLNKITKKLIFVASGDVNTGIRGSVLPKSKNPKGDLVKQLAEQNTGPSEQQALFALEEAPKKGIPSELVDYTAYVFLVHFSRRDCQIRYELSRISTPSTDGRISVSGVDRMIAPHYPLAESDFDEEALNDGFDGPSDFDVYEKS